MKKTTSNPFHMFCDNNINPIGVANPYPRLSWRLDGGADQKAFDLSLYNEDGHLTYKEKNDTSNNLCILSEYLYSRSKYTWQVTLDLKDGSKVTSPKGYFETGLFEGLKGDFIAYKNYKKRESPYFLKQISLAKDKEIYSARAYICGLGYYELTINGEKVGNSCLAPGWTDYNVRVLYDTYDITSLLKEGANSIGVQLGEGWLGHEHEFFDKVIRRQPSWQNDPCLKMDIYIKYDDDTEDVILTKADGSWLCAPSPLVMNNIYDGETYDAGKEIPGWNLPGFKPGADFTPAIPAANPPKGKMDSTLMPPIKEHTVMKAKEVHLPSEESITYDFGKNIAGWVRIKVRGARGSKVVIRLAETMDPDKNVNQANLRDAKQTDTYILKGEGIEIYKPKFTYHGFRYAQITVDPQAYLLECVAIRVNNVLERTGHFTCSDEMLNKIYDAIIDTEMNNEHSVPTDCPQRDERLGWINDATVRHEQTMLNFDAQLFLEKWLNDIKDSQDPLTGAIGDTAPYFYGDLPACHISSVYIQMPYLMYRYYNDISIIERFYRGMNAYGRFKLTTLDEKGLVDTKYAGDWAPPVTESEFNRHCSAFPANIGKQIISTGYVYLDCLTMEKCALLLDQKEDAAFYGKMAAVLKDNINTHCFDRVNSTYLPSSQGSNLFPLYLGIVPQEHQKAVEENLIKDIVEENQYHFTTGNQTTKHLFTVLNMLNRNDVAVEILKKEDYPSFGYMFAKGGTTIWERFENTTGLGMNSHNHPMHGSFASWYYKALAGIDPADHEGDLYYLRPDFVENLSFVKADCTIPKGKIYASWERKGDTVTYTVSIPWGTRGVICLRNGWRSEELSFGSYSLKIVKDTIDIEKLS